MNSLFRGALLVLAWGVTGTVQAAQAEGAATGATHAAHADRAATGSLAAHSERSAAASPTVHEYDLKAVCLSKIARFVEWPDSSLGASDAPFVVGVLGEDPFGASLERAFESVTISGRKPKVYRFRELRDLDACHLLYVAESARKSLCGILYAFREKPTLLVSDLPGFTEKGGTVGLAQADNRIGIQINRAAAERSGLKIESGLLRLAKATTKEKKCE